MKKTNLNILPFLAICFSVFFLILLFTTFNPTILSASTLTAERADYHSDTQINLRWVMTANAVEYEIFRNGISIDIINDVDLERNYHVYIDTNLVPSTTYQYYIEARDRNSTIIYTYLPVSINTSQIKKPSIVAAYLDINSNEVFISWKNESLASTKALVYNRTTSLVVAQTAFDESSISFSDTALNLGTSNDYYLVLEDVNGNQSLPSENIKITPIDLPEIHASIKSGVTTITWNRVPHLNEYVLERSEYTDDQWLEWKVIKSNLRENTLKVTDQTGSIIQFRYRLRIDTDKYKGVSNISNPIKVLSPPTELNVLYLESGKIELSWSNPENPDYTIRIERRSNSERYITIATVDKNINSYIDTYQIKDNTSYSYRITAIDPYGNTAYSEISAYSGIPLSPRNLSVYIYENKVELIWEDTSNNESGFIVERRINFGDYVEIADLNENTCSYIDHNRSYLSNSDTCTYRVISYNASGKSRNYTNDVIVLPYSQIPNNLYPLITNISSTSSGQVELTWISSTYQTIIERKEPSKSNWKIIEVLDPGISEFTDDKLLSNTEYNYRISFLLDDNVYLSSSSTTFTSITTNSNLPKNIKISSENRNTIKISWSVLENSSDIVIIERKTVLGTFIQVDEVKHPKNVWYDYNSNSINNTYRIKIRNGTNESIYSHELSIDDTTFFDDSQKSLSFEQLSNSEILLKWSDNSNRESGYYVEVKKDNSWQKLAVLESNSTSYRVKGLLLNTEYIFRVSAFDERYNIVESSNEIKATLTNSTPSLIDPEISTLTNKIENIEVRILTSNHLVIKWPKATNNDIDFYLILQENARKEFVEIGKVKNEERFLIKHLNPNTIYRFKIVGYKDNFEISSSDIVSVSTLRKVTFDDIYNVPWAQEAIEALASCNIIKGKSISSNLYAPNDNITRAEFVNLLIKSMDIKQTPYGSYSDVQPQHWYYESVMIATNIGLVSATENNFFKPNEAINREEIAVLTSKALKLIGIAPANYDTSILNSFNDKNIISSNALDSFALLYNEGIINGVSSSQMAPNNLTTRAEVAVIICKLLEKIWLAI